MSKSKFTYIGVEIICFLFIFLFVYAALSKLLDFQNFLAQLGQSPLLGRIVWWVAWIIPLTEILISIMLMLSRWRRLGLYASFCLMVMFTCYIIAITRFSTHIPCTCGGVLQNMRWNQHLVFNLGFVLLSLMGILLYDNQPKNNVAHA